MATKDRFPPYDRIPLFLSEQAEEPEWSGIWKIVVLMTIVLVFSAAAVGFAIAPAGNPLSLFANAKASQVRTSPQDIAAPSVPSVQSIASAQALSLTKEAPRGDQLIAAFKNAFESKAEGNQPPAEALLNQFQAWAAEDEVKAQVRPTQHVRDARAEARPIQPGQTYRTNP
jgi:hypothetical protein